MIRKVIFQDLISKHTIHQRALQAVMIKIHEIIGDIAPLIMNSIFLFRENVHNTFRFYQTTQRIQ